MSSQVIEARLLACRLDKKSLTDFSSEVDKLAVNLKRSLIMEGTSSIKAQEMTIAKVIETCRKSARNDLVKTVLAAGSFKDHTEVLAKFTIEIDEQLKDRQVLAYSRQNNFRRNNFQYESFTRNHNNNFHNNGDYSNNGFQNHDYSNNRYNNRYNNNRNNNNRYNNNRDNDSFFSNNNRSNGNYNNSNGNRAHNYYPRTANFDGQNDQPNIRAFNQGNEISPIERMGVVQQHEM